jgi:hypothetical protein
MGSGSLNESKIVLRVATFVPGKRESPSPNHRKGFAEKRARIDT